MIKELYIKQVRNISEAKLVDLGRVNLISGQNGSGKTSVLEALFLLATGRSFRTNKTKNIIQFEKSDLAVSIKLTSPSLSIGTIRCRDGSKLLKLGGEKINRLSDIADYLPVQAIHSETFDLLTGSPSVRRRFLDWGVFHVEHSFLNAWKQCERALKQRNELLRRDNIETSSIDLWSQQLVQQAVQIDQYRQVYFDGFKVLLAERLADIGLPNVDITYYRGWRKETDLAEQLTLNLDKDFQRGSTSIGPHRADIRFRVNGIGAGEVLSRGQQKLLAGMLMVVQGEYLNQHNRKSTVYLVDDLPAELDINFQHYFIDVLKKTNAQVFITGIQADELSQLWLATNQRYENKLDFSESILSKKSSVDYISTAQNSNMQVDELTKVRMFHVEHGTIEDVDSK